ncbi:MAG: MauE/DoxX family redox-associated membrane protein, partial [Bacteroidota bacterium]
MSIKIAIYLALSGMFGRLLQRFLGLVFIISGVAKMWDVYGFSEIARDYHILPQAFVIPFSILVPFAEFVLGLMLVLNYLPKISSLTLLLMVSMFTVFTLLRYASGNASECGCFGTLIHRGVDWKFFAENIMLIGGLVV